MTDESTFAWNEVQTQPPLIEPVGLGAAELRLKYTYAYPDKVSEFLKPVQFCNLFRAHKIQALEDIELIQSEDSRPLFCALYHTRFHEAATQVGRPPANKLSLFQFAKDSRNTRDFVALEHVYTLENLDYYQRHILKAENQLYLYGGVSFYVFNLTTKKASMV